MPDPIMEIESADVPEGYAEWSEDARQEYRKLTMNALTKKQKRVAIANHFGHDIGANGMLSDETLGDLMALLYNYE